MLVSIKTIGKFTGRHRGVGESDYRASKCLVGAKVPIMLMTYFGIGRKVGVNLVSQPQQGQLREVNQ